MGGFGTPGGNRTHNPRLRRPVLCPLSYGRIPVSLPRPDTASKNSIKNGAGPSRGSGVIYSRKPLIVNGNSASSL